MNKDDFFLSTFADWKLEEVFLSKREAYLVKQTFDYVSPSGSAYKYTEEGVHRISNHFVHNVASCNWTIDGCFYNGSRDVMAFCRWEDFTRMTCEVRGEVGYFVKGIFTKIA